MKIINDLFKKLNDNSFFYNILQKENFAFDERIKNFLDNDRESIINRIKILEKENFVEQLTMENLKAFYRYNQYINFSEQDIEVIKDIYRKLFEKIQNKNISSIQIEEYYFHELKSVIKRKKVLENNENMILPKICSEYSFELQLKVLDLDIDNIFEPLLDIGCGENGNLVENLVYRGFQARGIDRMVNNRYNCTNKNWFEFDYGEEKYGTIVSNLSFSSHFLYNYKNNTCLIEDYKNTYNKILKSIKIGGEWHYSPSLPFMEKYLSDKKYQVYNRKVVNDIYNTIIKKLK